VKTIYTIPAPDSMSATIEVYGDPDNAWYEWRILDGGRTVRDTGKEGHSAFQGRQYGQAEIALRDALMFASGLKDGYTMEAEQRQQTRLVAQADAADADMQAFMDEAAADTFGSLDEGYAAKARAERS